MFSWGTRTPCESCSRRLTRGRRQGLAALAAVLFRGPVSKLTGTDRAILPASYMWLVYVLALVVGGGLMLVQAVSRGPDTIDVGHSLDIQHHGGGPGVLSIRFFIYGLFAFGFVGAALHILRITGRWPALLLALASGVGAGLAAGVTF